MKREQTLLKVPDCLKPEVTGEYVETDDFVKDKAESLISHKEEQQDNLEISFIVAKEKPLTSSASVITEEYVESKNLSQEKVESQVTCEADDQPLQGVTYATYVCSFNSCAFMTTVMNDKIRAEHYLSCHPDSVSLGEQQEFLKLT